MEGRAVLADGAPDGFSAKIMRLYENIRISKKKRAGTKESFTHSLDRPARPVFLRPRTDVRGRFEGGKLGRASRQSPEMVSKIKIIKLSLVLLHTFQNLKIEHRVNYSLIISFVGGHDLDAVGSGTVLCVCRSLRLVVVAED